MFIDEVEIEVAAGAGGNGCVAFRREKYVPRGGPSGGDGGNGGSVLLVSTARLNTLYHFQHQRQFHAQRGQHGMGSKCHGKRGEDLRIEVPVGSLVTDLETGEGVHDFTADGEELLVARGGNGGWGNARFATATRQAPDFAKEGKEGEVRRLRIELKLLADVGLIGMPNAGKSTLISRLSAARPKIADYPFTTLVPNLGVATIDGLETIVIADVPGLIEGASDGAGLGIRFLKHVERCALLCHLVDLSGEGDAAADIAVVERELVRFEPGLAARPRLYIGTKVDAENADRRSSFERFLAADGRSGRAISAVTGAGIRDLLGELVRRVGELRAAARLTVGDDEASTP